MVLAVNRIYINRVIVEDILAVKFTLSSLFRTLVNNIWFQEVCKPMTNHTVDDQTLLTSVFRGLSVAFNYTGSAECLDFSSAFPDDVIYGWNYQVSFQLSCNIFNHIIIILKLNEITHSKYLAKFYFPKDGVGFIYEMYKRINCK